MSERKFTRALGKPGMAAQLRETVSQVVRESTVQNKLRLIDPIDYESFILNNKTLINNDGHREILLYPSDDVSQGVLQREYRTVVATAPQIKFEEANLLSKQCIKSYSSDWHLIYYKYSAYSGSYIDLPGYNGGKFDDQLNDEIYEIDLDENQITEIEIKGDGITKEGYLLKAPEISVSERIIFSNIGPKSFKKRFCHLRQQFDGSYILEIFKDEKKNDVKIANLDFCKAITRNPKRGRYCFELKMNAPHKSYTLAAENASELEDWIVKLNNVLQHYKQQEEKHADWMEKPCDTLAPSSQPIKAYGTLKSLEQSMNPQLIKYSQETDISIASARKKNRKYLFQMHLTQQNNKVLPCPDSNIEPYKEQFNQRIFVKCDNIKFRLQALIDEQESLSQVEPYFTTLSIFDARNNRKLSENFYFDINNECVRKLIKYVNHAGVLSNNSLELQVDCKTISASYFSSVRQAIFSISNPHPDIFLVIRIDKILQGSICQTSEPYIRAAKDPRLGTKIHKQVQAYCQRLGNYRMPFAWSARPLFRLYSNELDTSSDFPVIYRQEGNKIKDDELLKLLSEYRKPDKLNKLTVIPGWIKMKIEAITEIPKNCLTTSLETLKPFSTAEMTEITLEMAEFENSCVKDVHPYTTFINHLYVYPQSLLLDAQKIFTRARNIACIVEMRDSDDDKARPLKCIYGRPGTALLISRMSCPVLHHNATPSWYEEIKIRLPFKLHQKHHLLFSFYHISCDINKKKDIRVENCIGYAWLPLLSKGRLVFVEDNAQILPVAIDLPSGYLAIQPLGLGKGNAGPEILWIDSQKPIFTVSVQINSTVFTRDVHLHNLFAHAEKIIEPMPVAVPSDSETCKILKAAHAMQLVTIITFLPTILNQLFTLLTCNVSDEVGQQTVRLLIHIINMIHEAGREETLLAYVKFIFVPPENQQNGSVTVHEQLAKYLPLLLLPSNTDTLLLNKFMHHSGLLFDVMIKSMAQHLLTSGRIKMHRYERFPKEYQEQIEIFVQLIIPQLINKYKDLAQETSALNKSLAQFLKRCLTFMDRGLVFRLINLYIDKFASGSSRTLHDFKYNFLQIICSHEHYISFNLPLMQTWITSKEESETKPENDDTLRSEYYLTENFCKYHFLVGLLLQQVKLSLNELSIMRKVAIGTLRDLLAKHELDDRYRDKGRMSRIASLYIPWLDIVLENSDRFESVDNLAKGNAERNLEGKAGIENRVSACFVRQDLNYAASTATVNNVSTEPGTPVKLSSHRCSPLMEPQHSPMKHSANIRDSTYLAAIAGHHMVNGFSCTSIESDPSTVSSATNSNVSQDTAILNCDYMEMNSDGAEPKGHSRSISVSQATVAPPRFDKFQSTEVQDLLLCFLFVIKYVDDDQITTWWQQCNDLEIQRFLSVTELCLHHFKYLGKRQSAPNVGQDVDKPKAVKSMTLPARMAPPDFSSDSSPTTTGTLQPQNTTVIRENLLENDCEKMHYIMKQANLSVEVGLVVLDCLGLFCLQFKDLLSEADGTNPIVQQVFNVYLSFLQIGQSEGLFRHVFASLRALLNNYSAILFRGNAVLCGRLCYELLRCCNSKLNSIRQESCALLYLLMRSNFEFTSRKGLTRVHLQVIISVSQMLGNIISLNNSRFQESLSLINSYACSDKVMKGTVFPMEVQDLSRRIRTVLMATTQMREHKNDPDMLLELEHSLANSYASTPELRHTWLEAMARNHVTDGNFSEAACCQLHVSALMAEYLKLNDLNDWGAEAFDKISKNISRDEKGLKFDAGIQDIHYNEQMLLEQLETCADMLDKAERFELLGHVYRLIIPIYEKKRNYQALANCYAHLTQTSNKIVQVNKSGKRLLGRFYKVAFYGSLYFEREDGMEYIYKEPKVTSLSEVSERLLNLYSEKFGSKNVKLIMDSSVDISELSPKLAYIQVIYVTPYFDEIELESRVTDFERNHDISTFMFESPFTLEGSKSRGDPQEQWKRRTVLTTQCSFPYIKKRIEVVNKTITELNPIQVALDEMRQRVKELQEVSLTSGPADAKKLQLKLQGSVCVTVNAGPLAYANAFLNPNEPSDYTDDLVLELKDVFREFIKICYTALQINSKLISCDQFEYQEALRENYQKFCQNLSTLLGESVWPDEHITSFKRNSAALFNAISGTTNSHSSTA